MTMKPTIHIGWLLLFAIILLAAGWFANEWMNAPQQTVTIKKGKEFDIITLKLPNNPDPEIFGSKFWEALHSIVEDIPCPACRSKAVPFMKFFHDVVNKSLKKPLYDKDNYDFWINYLCKKEK